MRFSVVINTYNRAESLKNALSSLKYQNYEDFEVIVVNGPSDDKTEELLSLYKDEIKVINCPFRNLSISRNLGIEASAGEIVAFMDDDAIADSNWLKDLNEAYSDGDIGGAGGIVFDHTGMKLQYQYSSCDRTGTTDFTIKPPFDEYNLPGHNKFLYLQGTNCSFRKDVLLKIGGFDETYEYYLDEVDVCMRVIDVGYKLAPLDKAVVYHKYQKSYIRNENRIVLHPYSTVKNRFYFALKNAAEAEKSQVNELLDKWKNEVITGGRSNLLKELITEEEFGIYRDEVEKAAQDGVLAAKEGAKTHVFENSKKNDFLPFYTLKPSDRKLKICYVSKEYPPGSIGGIGRYTYDLATTFASNGHEVHVITEGKDIDTVDFEDGVWVHRLVSCLYAPFQKLNLGWNLSLQARNYREIKRISKYGKIDIINGPIWLCETGMICLDDSFATLVTLETTQRILNSLTDEPKAHSFEDKLTKLEDSTISNHKYIHAISSGILSKCIDYADDNAFSFVSPLGCRDLSPYYETSEKDKIYILSTGRLEIRKGVDILLKSAEDILLSGDHDNVYFIWAGKDTGNVSGGKSYRLEFEEKYKNNKFMLEHVRFLGEVPESQLMQCYRDASIVCTPSRYESFGIVLLEAMSFDNAIVAANVGGMKDIIVDGVTGLFFESENSNDLTTKLLRLINDSEYRKILSHNAREEFEKKYSLSAVYSNLYCRYLEIINMNELTKTQKHGFDYTSYKKYIADAEGISNKKAERIVQKITSMIDGNLIESVAVENGYTKGNTAKIYRRLNKVFPKYMSGLRNRYESHLPLYFQSNWKGKIYILLKVLIKELYRIPVFGVILHYLFAFIALPIRAESIRKDNEKLMKYSLDAASKIDTNRNSIISLSKNIQYNSSMNQMLLDRINMIRSEILFELSRENNVLDSEEKIIPTIVNNEKYDSQNGAFRLNVGAGHVHLDDMLNVDSREIEGIDVVAEAGNIPINDESAAEIFASHLIEHFPRRRFINNLLPYWLGKLRKGGVARFVLPDIEEMIKQYNTNNYNLDDFIEVTYGLQEYVGDLHYTLYGRKELINILENAGFENVRYSFTGRKNGKCFDMEIVGNKPM